MWQPEEARLQVFVEERAKKWVIQENHCVIRPKGIFTSNRLQSMEQLVV